ncbi:DUF6290 family protein [Fusobacterium pseudoperiodonticum]|jgi:hypothetical protein|uniref:DUF6290 family protein n=1 Tax=Fusobacterium pseudoperiodonticum TaxID=2663009 RepID=UPI0028D496A9|nr:DUF6290 family protein [Fusobacterium pseudoperiodonticum]
MSKVKRNILQFTLFKFVKKVVLDYIEDEYDLKVYKEYLKEKETGTLKTYSHKEVWEK